MILTIIYGLLGLGVIVFIHELGHFIAARACGVTVETFSLGWGPVLLRKKIGDTEYRLSLIPIGGYCGMKGDKAFQEALDKKLDAIPREQGSFYGVPAYKRIIIAFSGPFSNLLFAAIAFTIIALTGYSYQSPGNRVVLAPGITESAALSAGIQSGDTILSIDGSPVANFSDIVQMVGTHPDEALEMRIERNGEIRNVTATPALNKSKGTGQLGVMAWIDPIIESVTPGSAAANAGLQKGDVITDVNGVPVENTLDIQAFLTDKPASLDITYQRDGKRFSVPLVITYTGDTGDVGLGFKLDTFRTPSYNFFEAVWQGIKETGNMIGLTVKGIGLLFRGVDITEAVSGPVRITVMLGDTVESGFSAGIKIGIVSVLNLLALISVSLFLMNLLPIPILDGGLILFAVIELIRRKEVSPQTLYKVQFIGIAFIVILFVVALFGDIRYLFTR